MCIYICIYIYIYVDLAQGSQLRLTKVMFLSELGLEFLASQPVPRNLLCFGVSERELLQTGELHLNLKGNLLQPLALFESNAV